MRMDNQRYIDLVARKYLRKSRGQDFGYNNEESENHGGINEGNNSNNGKVGKGNVGHNQSNHQGTTIGVAIEDLNQATLNANNVMNLEVACATNAEKSRKIVCARGGGATSRVGGDAIQVENKRYRCDSREVSMSYYVW